MARLNKVCPELPAADVGAAASWYRDKLGFNIERLYPEAGFAIVSRDDIEIHFWTCKERRIAEHTSAYFNVDDVDALHATLSEANDGGRLSEVADRPWGMREFYVWDPDGNLLKFGVSTSTAGE